MTDRMATDKARTGGGWEAKVRALPPAIQTAAVFALAAGLVGVTLPFVGRVADPGAWVLASVATGLVVALVFALAQWRRERMASARGGALADDRLTVEPLAARELGVRFDDSPYLTKARAEGDGEDQGEAAEVVSVPVPRTEPAPAGDGAPVVNDTGPIDDADGTVVVVDGSVAPAPPTPDSRIDPDSPLGAPRWRVPGEASDTGATPDDRLEVDGAEPAPLIARGDGWDRDAPHPDGEWEPVVADVPLNQPEGDPTPGDAAAQWDGRADEEGDVGDGPAAAPPSVVRVSPARPATSPMASAPAASPAPRPEGPAPTTDELLARLMRAAAARSASPAGPVSPPPMSGDAADELARALVALRGAA